ncbi:MAG: peptide ABC transporter substrate-binding protein, partial [Chloroflexi bacterium]
MGAVAALVVVAAASLGVALALKEGFIGGPDFREGLVEAQTPLSLNPLIGAGDPAVHDVGQLLYRSLLRLDSSAYPRPDLAESYTVSRDGLTYRMVLSPNQRWSDGRPITASDVTATVVFVRSAYATDHALAALLQGVKVSVESSDVLFVLPAPRASFPATLTQL